MAAEEGSRFFALLIGIDGYVDKPLSGCVNDVEKVAGFLHDKLGVPGTSIRKMLAPLDGSPAEPPAESHPAYDNLVAALRALASPDMRRGDRIFIYYSGHGSYEKIPLADSYFEGLVPVDHEEKGLLYDVELNGLLQAIARRTGDLTVILDCCHSAGTTRAVSGDSDDLHIRYAPVIRSSLGREAEVQRRFSALTSDVHQTMAAEEYTVVAACHADEPAAECRTPPTQGKYYGLFTYLLFELLSRVDTRALVKLRWSDIWEQLRGSMHKARPDQRPVILGPRARPIFGGPWTAQDAGYPIRKNEDGSFQIGAGTLAGLSPGALIAVYGPTPDLFPPLDSEADRQACVGLLTVENAKVAESVAQANPRGAVLDLPAAARGRLIKPGTPDRLQVVIEPNVNPRLRQLLSNRASSHAYAVCSPNGGSTEVRIGQYDNGDVYVGDDLFGPGPPLDLRAPGPIARVRLREVVDLDEMADGLCAGLDHYAQYVIPLRVVRNGGHTLPDTAIQVKLLACQDVHANREMERDTNLRPEVRRDPANHRYLIRSGDGIAIHLQNTLSRDLYVFLLLCNLEGQIEFLDEDVVLHRRSGKIFWHENIIGNPFELEAPPGYDWGIDRLIVIATDQKGLSLAGLKQRKTLSEAIRSAMGTKSTTKSSVKTPNTVRWTAVQTLIQVGAGLIS